MDDTRSLQNVLAYGAMGFGAAATLAPSVFVSSYGMRATPTTNIFVRLFGTRSLALGGLYLTTEDDKTRRVLTATSFAMNVADTALIATAGDLPTKSRVLGAVTTAFFAGLAGWVLAQQ